MTEIISFIFGCIVGAGFVTILFLKAFVKSEQFRQNNVEELQNELPYTMEKHNSMYYAFELDDTFIAQGSSFEELSKNMEARYPNTTFILSSFTSEISDELQQRLNQIGTDITNILENNRDRN
jgi:hypothetical protein